MGPWWLNELKHAVRWFLSHVHETNKISPKQALISVLAETQIYKNKVNREQIYLCKTELNSLRKVMTSEFNLKIVKYQIFFSDHAVQNSLEISSHLTSSLTHKQLVYSHWWFRLPLCWTEHCGERGQPRLWAVKALTGISLITMIERTGLCSRNTIQREQKGHIHTTEFTHLSSLIRFFSVLSVLLPNSYTVVQSVTR